MSWKSEVESAVSVQPEQFTRLKNRRNLSRFSESLCKPFQAGNEDEENESKLEEEVQLPSFATVVGSDNLDSIVGGKYGGVPYLLLQVRAKQCHEP
jgi:hypothetical protein